MLKALGLEGQEALRKEWRETRIIFMSGRDDPSVRQTALEAGAFGFLSNRFTTKLSSKWWTRLWWPDRHSVDRVPIGLRSDVRLGEMPP